MWDSQRFFQPCEISLYCLRNPLIKTRCHFAALANDKIDNYEIVVSHPLSENLTFFSSCNCFRQRIGQLEGYGEWSKGAGAFPYLIQGTILWMQFRSMALATLVLEKQLFCKVCDN